MITHYQEAETIISRLHFSLPNIYAPKANLKKKELAFQKVKKCSIASVFLYRIKLHLFVPAVTRSREGKWKPRISFWLETE